MVAETLGEGWRIAQHRLAVAGISAARLEARFLLERATACSYRDLLVDAGKPLSAEAWSGLESLLLRREQGEPLAYILGEQDFRGRPFRVSPAVLIPRADTEVLVDQALIRLRGLVAPRVLDLGTGSGIVAISLALECPDSSVLAVDVDAEALAVARKNADCLQAKLDLRQGDWFGPVQGERFDLVVSNPPYIAEGDPHLALNGLPFEPRLALTDGQDGLACIRQIVAGAPAHLNPGGWLLFEHGYDQGQASRNLLASAGFKDASTIPDLAGHDRVSGGHL